MIHLYDWLIRRIVCDGAKRENGPECPCSTIQWVQVLYRNNLRRSLSKFSIHGRPRDSSVNVMEIPKRQQALYLWTRSSQNRICCRKVSPSILSQWDYWCQPAKDTTENPSHLLIYLSEMLYPRGCHARRICGQRFHRVVRIGQVEHKSTYSSEWKLRFVYECMMKLRSWLDHSCLVVVNTGKGGVVQNVK